MPLNSPQYDEAVETSWDGVDQEEFENFEQFASVHVWWNTENPETGEDVELPVAHMEDGELKLVYEALNSAHDSAENAIEDQEDVENVRELLEDLREEEFPDREPLDADENNAMSPGQDDNTRKVNQLTEEELKEISQKAGTDEAPKVHKHFQINSKDIKQGEDEDGNPVYRVPISGDAQDRDQDQMALEGQEHMVEQLQTGKTPVYGDHGRHEEGPRYSFKNILGQFIDGELSQINDQEKNEGEHVTLADMRLRMSHPDAEELQELLEGDWPVGFSVGFIPKEVEEVRNDDDELVGLKMKRIDLLEASAVGIPSQPDSVPVGIDTNSTEAALAVKNVLDEASEEGKEVDVDELQKGLEKSILGENSTMPNKKDGGDGDGDGDGKDSSFIEENRDSFKTLIKESLREFKSEELQREVSQKAPEDVGRGDILSFVVDHFDGAEVSDIEAGLPDDSEYIGELDLNAYANLLAVLADTSQGDAQQALEQVLDELMSDGDDEGDVDEEEENSEENETDEDEEDEDEDEEEMANQFEGLDIEVDEFKERVAEELDTEPDEIDLSRPVTELSEEEFKAMRKVAEGMEGLSEDDLTSVQNSSGPKGTGPIQTGDGNGDGGKSNSGNEDSKDTDFSFGGRP